MKYYNIKYVLCSCLTLENCKITNKQGLNCVGPAEANDQHFMEVKHLSLTFLTNVHSLINKERKGYSFRLYLYPVHRKYLLLLKFFMYIFLYFVFYSGWRTLFVVCSCQKFRPSVRIKPSQSSRWFYF